MSIDKSDIFITTKNAMLGNISSSMRMINMIIDLEQKTIYFIGYFDKKPRNFEIELMYDISAEVEGSLMHPIYRCKGISVFYSGSLIESETIEQFEKSLCSSPFLNTCCYLRFGEYGEKEDFQDYELDVAQQNNYVDLHG